MPPNTRPRNSRNAPTAAKAGANDGPGMWMPAGVFGWIRCFPRRAGGAVRIRRIIQSRKNTTKTAMITGMTPMILPQSGVTNSAVSWRRRVQIRSSIGRRRQAVRSGRVPVTRPWTRRPGRRP